MMLLLRHRYGLSDPVPDETMLVAFRQRLVRAGLHEQLLGLVNQQLEERGFILKRVTLIDATLQQAARRAPDKGSGGDPEADYTVKNGQPHCGFKAHVAVDEERTVIRKAELGPGSEHDSRRFEDVVAGDERMVVADKAYWSRDRGAWLSERIIENGILRRGARNHPLGEPARRLNRFLSGVRARIEGVFGDWKRSLGYRRVRYIGILRNRLELEVKCVVWNLRRWENLAAKAGKPWPPGPSRGTKASSQRCRDLFRKQHAHRHRFPNAFPRNLHHPISVHARCLKSE